MVKNVRKKSKEKVAVVLFNLGGPDKRSAIKPFLFNFFMDKNIIGAPKPVRYLLARWISYKRSRKEAGDSYEALGGRSPLLPNTQAQAAAVQKLLDNDKTRDYKVFVSMRYWHPMAPEVIKKIKAYKPDQIVLLPLYPQFSTTTTGSSFEDWTKACKQAGLDVPTQKICCYPFADSFVRASALLIAEQFGQLSTQEHKKTRLLFSAHGLPETVIKRGDPYQWQCETTAEKIAALLKTDYGLKGLDWQICYQSRVGPLKWIGPSTEQALEKAAHDKKNVMIYPHAFVSEHVETLVEIEEEYRELAEEMGIHGFMRVPTVSTHPVFIKGLADMVKTRLKNPKDNGAPAPDAGARLCGMGYKKCPCQVNA